MDWGATWMIFSFWFLDLCPNSKLAGDVRSQVEQFYELAVSRASGSEIILILPVKSELPFSSELQATDLLGKREVE